MQFQGLLVLRPWSEYQTVRQESVLLEVTSLSLDSKGLVELPHCISLLTKLQKLDLHANRISVLPQFLGELTNLTELCLQDNPLVELPESITKLRKLARLQIEYGGVINLKRVPRGITSLPCWTNNQRSGGMLRSFADSLASLDFGPGGPIDHDTFMANPRLHLMTEVNIARAGWSLLPLQFSSLINLRSIDLSANSFSEFPPALLELTGLTKIDISGNRITRIPSEITNLSNLQQLKTSRHGTVGSVRLLPVEITNLPCWENNPDLHRYDLYADFSRRDLRDLGYIVHQCIDVVSLDLSQNKLTALPSTMTRLTSLLHLDISYNEMPHFPTALGNMTWLTSLHISRNRFTALPDCITNLSRLERLQIADKSGQITVASGPSELSTLPCWKTDKSLHSVQLIRTPSSPTRPPRQAPNPQLSSPKSVPGTPSKTMHISLDGSERPRDEEIMEKKLRVQQAPILFSKDADRDVNVNCNIAVSSGLFCMLCLNIVLDPCVLSCEHLFCSSCIEFSIRDSQLRAPFSCPICRKPSITHNEVTPAMRGRACYLKEKTSIPDQNLTVEQTAPDAGETESVAESYLSAIICESVRDRVRDASNPKAHKKCVRHELEIKYYCKCCVDNPLKCAECLAYDHRHKPKKNHDYTSLPKDEGELKKILDEYLKKVEDKLAATNINEADIIKEIKNYDVSYDQAKKQREDYFITLRELVDEYDRNSKAQLESLYSEVKGELQRKLKQVRGDKQRLQFAVNLVDWCSQLGQDRHSLTEIANTLYLCGNFTKVSAEAINIQHRAITVNRADDIVKRLELLNTQLMSGANDPGLFTSFQGALPANEEPGNSFPTCEYVESCVRDEENGFVIIKKNDGQYISLKTAISFDGGLNSLRSLSMSPAGTLAVADSFRHCVLIYNLQDFSLGGVIRSYPNDPKERLLQNPSCVAHDSKGQIYIADSGNSRVLSYTAMGSPVACEYLVKHVDEAQAKPISICVDHKDDLLVVCAASDKVLIFTNLLRFAKKVPIARIPTSGCVSISAQVKGHFVIKDLFLQTSAEYRYEDYVESIGQLE